MVGREDSVKFDPDSLLLEGTNATDNASTPQAWSPGGALLVSTPALQTLDNCDREELSLVVPIQLGG